MKKIFALAALAATLAVPSLASAQSATPWYAEVGASALKFEAFDSTHNNMTLKIGREITESISVEGQFLPANSKTINGVNIKLTTMGVFGKYTHNMGDFSPYARLGLTSSSLNEGGVKNSSASFGYGVGLNYSFTKNVYGNFDYTAYHNKSDEKIHGLSVGVGYKF